MNAPKKKVAMRNIPLHPNLRAQTTRFQEEFYALVANKQDDIRYWTQFSEVWGEVNRQGLGEGDGVPTPNTHLFWAGKPRVCAPITKRMAATLVRMKRTTDFRSLVLHKRTKGSQPIRWNPTDAELARILDGPKEKQKDQYSTEAAQEKARARVAELFSSGVINVGVADKSSPRPKRT